MSCRTRRRRDPGPMHPGERWVPALASLGGMTMRNDAPARHSTQRAAEAADSMVESGPLVAKHRLGVKEEVQVLGSRQGRVRSGRRRDVSCTSTCSFRNKGRPSGRPFMFSDKQRRPDESKDGDVLLQFVSIGNSRAAALPLWLPNIYFRSGLRYWSFSLLNYVEKGEFMRGNNHLRQGVTE